MADTELTKTCTKCGEILPATAEYFHQQKKGKYGLRPQCKTCILEYNRQYQEENSEKIAEYHCQYRKTNREKIAESIRQYRKTNREKVVEQQQKYQKTNREKIAEYKRRYRKANPEKRRIALSRYRARKRNLPDIFTSEQWLQCLEYFNYCCPVCDSQLRDLFGNVKPHADHWIPLDYDGDDNPGTVATNMICLCNACNLSKSATMPDVWLKQKFGTRKAAQISVRIQAYFETIAQSELSNA